MLQRIKINIESGESKEESGKVIWTNSEVGQIIEDIESLSFIEKGSHSFKESYGLKEFLSHIERQSTVLDVLLVQVKTIVSILTKYDSIEGMEESTNLILQCDSLLNSNIAEIIELFNQTSQTKIYSLSKIDSILVRTIEDAQGIICLWKQSPLSPLFNAVWDQLVQAWIYIDIFDTQCSYKLAGQSETFTNQIFKRLFEILTKKKFRIHQDKCIQNWDPKQNKLIDSDDKDEEENEKEADCSNIDRK